MAGVVVHPVSMQGTRRKVAGPTRLQAALTEKRGRPRPTPKAVGFVVCWGRGTNRSRDSAEVAASRQPNGKGHRNFQFRDRKPEEKPLIVFRRRTTRGGGTRKLRFEEKVSKGENLTWRENGPPGTKRNIRTPREGDPVWSLFCNHPYDVCFSGSGRVEEVGREGTDTDRERISGKVLDFSGARVGGPGRGESSKTEKTDRCRFRTGWGFRLTASLHDKRFIAQGAGSGTYWPARRVLCFSLRRKGRIAP